MPYLGELRVTLVRETPMEISSLLLGNSLGVHNFGVYLVYYNVTIIQYEIGRLTVKCLFLLKLWEFPLSVK